MPASSTWASRLQALKAWANSGVCLTERNSRFRAPLKRKFQEGNLYIFSEWHGATFKRNKRNHFCKSGEMAIQFAGVRIVATGLHGFFAMTPRNGCGRWNGRRTNSTGGNEPSGFRFNLILDCLNDTFNVFPMKFKSLLPILFLTVCIKSNAGDSQPAPVVPSGRYMLIMHSSNGLSPDPFIVRVKDGSLTAEDDPKVSCPLETSGSTLLFILKTPAKRGEPPQGQDWSKLNVLVCSGQPWPQIPGAIQGVFSDTITFHHNTEPMVQTGTFLLCPIDAKRD